MRIGVIYELPLKKIGKKAFGFGFGTLISRLTGLLREVVFAWIFGAGYEMDAFRVAWRIPNLIRDMLAEGALVPSFIPIFGDKYKKDKKSAYQFANNFSGTMLFISLIIVAIGVIFAPFWSKIIGPGFIKISYKFQLTVTLLRYVFFFLIFIVLAAFAMGVLNYFGRFFITGVTPAFFNIGIILCGVLLSKTLGIKSLAFGVVFGSFIYFLSQIVFFKDFGYKWRPQACLTSDVKHALKIMLPIALSYGVMRINSAINTVIATFLETGSVSYLEYAFRIMQLPVGIVGVALANVILPEVSHNPGETLRLVKSSIVYLLLICLPITLVLFFFPTPIVSIIYKRGAFTYTDAVNTGLALKYYGIGIIPVSLSRILSMCFYGLKRPKIPLQVTAWTILVNTSLAITFAKTLSFPGIALATSIAGVFNMTLLFIRLKKEIKFTQKHGS